MTTYPSKLGIGIALFITLVIGAVSVQMILEKEWLSFGINISVFVLVYLLYKSTNYTITGDNLNIKSSFIINENIDIKTITKIKETNNPLSAPAFSLDRLEITYGKGGSILISPREKTEFLNQLKSINKNIDIIYKK
ncbi:MAG: hypothetical protein B6I18_01125 [Bacteroidetes bacterium 4572_112]|nr:MAG: hypothetical protein B6I18_01125 [Bacteroidetes bacterium 4572_112]